MKQKMNQFQTMDSTEETITQLREAIRWRNLKKDFQNLDYENKLTWWDENVPRVENSKYGIQFQYSGEGAEGVSVQRVEITYMPYLNKISSSVQEDYQLDFISIRPQSNNTNEIDLFWEWLIPKIPVAMVSKLECEYETKLIKNHSANHSAMIQHFRESILREKEKLSGNHFYNLGYEYSRVGELNLDFVAPEYWLDLETTENIIDWTISGYNARLKEIAIDQVEKSMVSINQEITIEDLDTAGKRIALLYELGLFEILDTQQLNPNRMAALLHQITGIKVPTCKNIYRAIKNDFWDKNNPFTDDCRAKFDAIYRKLKITPTLIGTPNSMKSRK